MLSNRQFVILGALAVIAICIVGCLGLAVIGYLAQDTQIVIVPTTAPQQLPDTPAPEPTATTETATEIPSPESLETPVNTPEPTATTEAPGPTEPPIIEPTIAPVGDSVIIVTVDKDAEVVTLQNVSANPVDLAGWVLLSEKGEQRCNLSGVIQPNDTLEVWALAARIDKGGYNCGFDANIWNNSEPDPAVLFDQNGVEVYRVDCKTKVCS